MKKFFEKMSDDIKSEDFTKKEMIVYGILFPVILFIIMGIAGWMETCCA